MAPHPSPSTWIRLGLGWRPRSAADRAAPVRGGGQRARSRVAAIDAVRRDRAATRALAHLARRPRTRARMTRADLEHVFRAAADIASDDDIVIIDSQAILGQFPDAPPSLRVSVEADVYPRNHPERADLIDGTIGEGSPFHEAYGYYAQGVGETTAVLPAGWQERLIVVRNANTRGATGWCLEINDLTIAKAVAGREKDRQFVVDVLANGLADRATLETRLAATALDDATRARVRTLIGVAAGS